jgi:hypothetical protein
MTSTGVGDGVMPRSVNVVGTLGRYIGRTASVIGLTGVDLSMSELDWTRGQRRS